MISIVQSKVGFFRDPYVIKLIEPTEAPTGAEGVNWYHYLITQGPNAIHGYHQGTLESVTSYVEDNLDKLNERRFGKKATLVQSHRNSKRSG